MQGCGRCKDVACYFSAPAADMTKNTENKWLFDGNKHFHTLTGQIRTTLAPIKGHLDGSQRFVKLKPKSALRRFHSCGTSRLVTMSFWENHSTLGQLRDCNLCLFRGCPWCSQDCGLWLQDGLGSGVAVKLHHVLWTVPGGEGAVEAVISTQTAVQTHAPPLSL